MARAESTADRILDVAQHLLQTRGYNGFSYKDIAEALGIRTASIHYHFATKSDLGVALAGRYRARFGRKLEDICEGTTEPGRRLERLAGLFRQTFDVERRLCLCGMLGAEIASLPEAVAVEVEGFFRDTEAWIAEVLAAGRQEGILHFAGTSRDQARLLLAVLEGAMIVARGSRDRARFRRMVSVYLRRLRARRLDPHHGEGLSAIHVRRFRLPPRVGGAGGAACPRGRAGWPRPIRGQHRVGPSWHGLRLRHVLRLSARYG